MNDHEAYDALWNAAEHLDRAAMEADTVHARTALQAAARDLRFLALCLLWSAERGKDDGYSSST